MGDWEGGDEVCRYHCTRNGRRRRRTTLITAAQEIESAETPAVEDRSPEANSSKTACENPGQTHSTDPVAPNTKKSSWGDFLSGLVLVALCMGGLYLRFC